jgi:hypothetical protein
MLTSDTTGHTEEALMLNTLALEQDSPWNGLQQPVKAWNLAPLYLTLLSALDMGWAVEEPVDLRPRWSEAGPRVYHFLLRPPSAQAAQSKRLITINESAEVHRFVQRMGWRVYEIE